MFTVQQSLSLLCMLQPQLPQFLEFYCSLTDVSLPLFFHAIYADLDPLPSMMLGK